MYLEKGRLVEVRSKSVLPKTYSRFLAMCPDHIARIQRVIKNIVTLEHPSKSNPFSGQNYDGLNTTYKFTKDDIERILSPEEEDAYNKYYKIKKQKLITINNLLSDGACKDKLELFVSRVIRINPAFAWDPIPYELAQKIAIELGEPTWLKEHGFADKIIITNINVLDYKEYWVISSKDNNDRTWNLFKILKNGTGFVRYVGISANLADIATDSRGRIIELEKG